MMLLEILSDSMYTVVIAPIIGGIGWYIKRKMDEKEKRREEEKAEEERKRQEEIAERNRRRDEIEAAIAELKLDLVSLQQIILKCDKPDCPSKVLLLQYINDKLKGLKSNEIDRELHS